MLADIYHKTKEHFQASKQPANPALRPGTETFPEWWAIRGAKHWDYHSLKKVTVVYLLVRYTSQCVLLIRGCVLQTAYKCRFAVSTIF